MSRSQVPSSMTPRFAGLVGNRSQMCNGRVAGPKRPLLGEVSGIDALLRSFSVWTCVYQAFVRRKSCKANRPCNYRVLAHV